MMTAVEEAKMVDGLHTVIRRCYDAHRVVEKTWTRKDLERHDDAIKAQTEAWRLYLEFMADTQRELG